ncbi:hypothetical protein RND71_027456 [Anisodus tanguticus]|uniref:Hflx-type G domain-containing protein n=1 Tax=Anisodus tanguticus TaxID=243964 RepID=A0AAE1V0J9_9SOLA|nr:hypothetical protein RND71_027456 [Anisodus tanguticus]
MSLCFCSNLKPSILFPGSDYQWIQTRTRPVSFNRLSQTKYNYRGCIKATVGEEIGVLSPDDSVSVRNPAIEVPEREVFEEKAYLVDVACKGDTEDSFGIEESLKELAQLADTAGLLVDSTYQKLSSPNPRTYIGSGKVAEIKTVIRAFDVETVIFDDELSPGVCDRTALILDIFNQRAVSLAQMEYQLPWLTRMWTHLEWQSGGQVKGMGEKQIEVDKRILRTQQNASFNGTSMTSEIPWPSCIGSHGEIPWLSCIGSLGDALLLILNQSVMNMIAFLLCQSSRLVLIGVLKKELESVRKHRQQYRNRRVSVPVPVVSLVGYTNAGKSTLLNRLTGLMFLRRTNFLPHLILLQEGCSQMKNGKEFLLTDTVGFIQKLPTTLIAAFRATLEEIAESSILVHVSPTSRATDRSRGESSFRTGYIIYPKVDAVEQAKHDLSKPFFLYRSLVILNVDGLSSVSCCFSDAYCTRFVVDKAGDPEKIKLEAKTRSDVVCISAVTGEGLDEFCNEIQNRLKDAMVWVEALIPFDKGELLSTIHQVGMEYTEKGTLVRAHVPLRFARLLTPMRQMCVS